MFPSTSDRALLWLLRSGASVAGVILLLVAVFVLLEAWPALQDVGLSRFFTDADWQPGSNAETGQFNVTPLLIGSLLSTLLAMALAAPLGIGAALFCAFYAPAAIAGMYRRILELLAGVPSVVFGLWGLVALAPVLARWQPPGQSLLAAGSVLALMILPTVALLSLAALRAVPLSHWQAAQGLGLSRWACIRAAALPAARTGLLTAGLLATARAIGETMAVLMVAGNVVQLPDSLFAPIRTATANIALEMGYALDHHRAALFVTGLVLMALIAVLIGINERLGRVANHA